MKSRLSYTGTMPDNRVEGRTESNRARANDGVVELLAQLSEALELIYQCHTRGTEITSSLLDYTEQLIGEIEIHRTYFGRSEVGHC